MKELFEIAGLVAMLVFIALIVTCECVGRDCTKEVFARIGSVTTYPVRLIKRRMERKKIKKAWECFVEENEDKIMQELQERVQMEIHGCSQQYMPDEIGTALEKFADAAAEREERTWQDHIMERFTHIQ